MAMLPISPTRRAALFGRSVRASMVALLVASALVACSTRPSAPTPRTARVERATVATTVSAFGALSALTEQSLGFRTGGQLTGVRVKVGDRVSAGQILATIDDFAFRQVLAQRR